ncbi:MAG: PAS domain-containing protein, partial [Roseinatronobacter sp.]|nr:PAS domain-containing protein [Roseinatronobacter sp.]
MSGSQSDNERAYWALLGNLSIPVVVYDSTSGAQVCFLNDAAIKTYGYDMDELSTFDIAAQRVLPDPAYRETVVANWRVEVEARRTTAQNTPPKEYRIRDRWGRMRDVLIGFALHDHFIIVTAQDITKERATQTAQETERRQHERKAYLATKYMPGGTYSISLPDTKNEARFSFVSAAFCQMMGVRPDVATQGLRAAFAQIHPDDLGHWAAQYDKALAAKSDVQVEGRLLAGDQERQVYADARVRTTEAGETTWDGLVIDVTEWRETEKRLIAVLNDADAYTWRVDLRAGRITFDRARLPCDGSAWNDENVSLASWFEGVHPDDLAQTRLAYEMLSQGTVSKLIHVYRRNLVDGRQIWLRLHVGISAYDDTGLPTALSGVTFDITIEMESKLRAREEQAQLREDLQRAQQRDTVKQVAGGVAHDLNNLIAVISGTVEILENPSLGQEAAKDGLQRIRRSVGMAHDLIAGLGGVTRPDLPRGIHDMRKMVADGLELLGARRMARHGVTLARSEQALPVWANPTEVAQVVLNLTLNACESGLPGQDATVSLATLPLGSPLPNRPPDMGNIPDAGARMALFSVRDTGAGIPSDVRARMFRPNFTTKGTAGTGLGLLIVGNILKANRAALWVESSLGAGSVFPVAWPMDAPLLLPKLQAAPGHGLRAPDEAPAPDMVQGLRVLVVDDLLDVSEVLADMLDG